MNLKKNKNCAIQKELNWDGLFFKDGTNSMTEFFSFASSKTYFKKYVKLKYQKMNLTFFFCLEFLFKEKSFLILLFYTCFITDHWILKLIILVLEFCTIFIRPLDFKTKKFSLSFIAFSYHVIRF